MNRMNEMEDYITAQLCKTEGKASWRLTRIGNTIQTYQWHSHHVP